MATIVIKDLTENTELDRKAMIAIAGGSRFRTSAAGVGRTAPQRVRLYDLSLGRKAPATKSPAR